MAIVRSRRCAPPARPSDPPRRSRASDQLEAIADLDLADQRAVDRALGRDRLQALELILCQLGGNLDHDLEARTAASLARLVIDVDLELAHLPAIALGVHLQRNGRTGCEAE